MSCHQEHDLVGVVGGQPDALRQFLAERDALGDVAVAPPLADVVEQHAEHQQIRPLDVVQHVRRFGLRRLPRRQRLEILHGEQRVLVGGELVIDVVLDEAGQRLPLGQVPPEESELVHLAEGLRHPPPASADREEEIPHVGRAPELVVDQVQRFLDGALDVHAELEAEAVAVPEDLHEPRRILAERPAVGMGEVNLRVDHDEPVGERVLAEPPLDGPPAGQRLAAAGDEAARDAVDHPRVQVVVAHELLDPEGDLVARIAEVLGDLGLDVPRQHVVLVPGQEVQLVAHAPQEGQRLVGGLLLPLRDEPLVEQLAQRAGAELGRGEPHRGVDIAQAARRLLDIGLAHVRRAAELAIALIALGERRLEELGEVLLVDVLGEHLAEAIEEPPVPHEEPRLLHRRAARKVRPRHGETVRQAPDRVADLKPQVPERVEQALGDALSIRAHVAVVDDHEVEIGQRMELAAPVSAERHEHERDLRRALALGVLRGQAVQRREESVHERGIRLDGLLTRGSAQVGGAEKSHVRVEVLTEQIEPEPAAPVRPLGGRAIRALLRAGLGAADLAVEFRRHGETLQPRARYCQTRRELAANLPAPKRRLLQ